MEVDSSRICCSGLGEGSDILRGMGAGRRFGGSDAQVWACFALWWSGEGTRIGGVWSLGELSWSLIFGDGAGIAGQSRLWLTLTFRLTFVYTIFSGVSFSELILLTVVYRIEFRVTIVL